MEIIRLLTENATDITIIILLVLEKLNTIFKFFENVGNIVTKSRGAVKTETIILNRYVKNSKTLRDVSLIILPVIILILSYIFFEPSFFIFITISSGISSLTFGILLLLSDRYIKKINFSDTSSKLFMSGNYV